MSQILYIRYIVRPKALTITERAHQILEERGTDRAIDIDDPALLIEVERLNAERFHCKLAVAHGMQFPDSFGQALSPELSAHLTERVNKST